MSPGNLPAFLPFFFLPLLLQLLLFILCCCLSVEASRRAYELLSESLEAGACSPLPPWKRARQGGKERGWGVAFWGLAHAKASELKEHSALQFQILRGETENIRKHRESPSKNRDMGEMAGLYSQPFAGEECQAHLGSQAACSCFSVRSRICFSLSGQLLPLRPTEAMAGHRVGGWEQGWREKLRPCPACKGTANSQGGRISPE